MKKLSNFIRAYKSGLNDILFDIKEEKAHLKNDNSLWDDLDYTAEKRFIIDDNIENLSDKEKEELLTLDEKLLEIKKHLEGTIYEETFNEWFSKFLPKPATL